MGPANSHEAFSSVVYVNVFNQDEKDGWGISKRISIFKESSLDPRSATKAPSFLL